MNATPMDEVAETETRNRSQKSRWLVGQDAKGDDVMVELSTMHNGNPHYMFRSVLNRVTIKRGPNFTSCGFWLMDGVTVEDTPAKRFSAKGLVAAHDSAVSLLRAWWGQDHDGSAFDTKVLAKFAPVDVSDDLL